MKGKSAQAALEFLMTYGWAILVVLAAIGALAYFGILDPGRFVNNSCTLQSGFGCDDMKAFEPPANDVVFRIQNSLGKDITNVSVNLDTNDCTGFSPITVGTLDNGDQVSLNFSCSNDLEGILRADVEINYRLVGETVSHQAAGQLTLRVE